MKYISILLAQETATTIDLSAEVAQNFLTTNNIWMMISTALVFIMHLGFAGVEAGFGQAKKYREYIIQKYGYSYTWYSYLRRSWIFSNVSWI